MSKDAAANRLDLVAAKAKQLADDLRRGRLWEGDLDRGISEIIEQAKLASAEVRQR